jgi:hypothetical protein
MVLNGIQQALMRAYWDFLHRSLLEVDPAHRDTLVHFLDVFVSIDPSAELTDEQMKVMEDTMYCMPDEDQAECKQIYDIFRHPCPQNRCMTGTACDVHRGYVYFWVDGSDSDIVREKQGVLSLTAQNQPPAKRKPGSRDAIYDNAEAVTKRDVLMFLQGCIAQLIADLRGLALEEERSQAAMKLETAMKLEGLRNDFEVAMKLDARQLEQCLSKMQGLLVREREEALNRTSILQRKITKLEREKIAMLHQVGMSREADLLKRLVEKSQANVRKILSEDVDFPDSQYTCGEIHAQHSSKKIVMQMDALEGYLERVWHLDDDIKALIDLLHHSNAESDSQRYEPVILLLEDAHRKLDLAHQGLALLGVQEEFLATQTLRQLVEESCGFVSACVADGGWHPFSKPQHCNSRSFGELGTSDLFGRGDCERHFSMVL